MTVIVNNSNPLILLISFPCPFPTPTLKINSNLGFDITENLLYKNILTADSLQLNNIMNIIK